MLVFGQIWISKKSGVCVTTILGFQYQASTRLRYQWFENHLDDEPRIGTWFTKVWLALIEMKKMLKFYRFKKVKLSLYIKPLHFANNQRGMKKFIFPNQLSIETEMQTRDVKISSVRNKQHLQQKKKRQQPYIFFEAHAKLCLKIFQNSPLCPFECLSTLFQQVIQGSLYVITFLLFSLHFNFFLSL